MIHVAPTYEDKKCLRTATESDNYAIIMKGRLLECQVEIQRLTRRKLAPLDLIGCLDLPSGHYTLFITRSSVEEEQPSVSIIEKPS